MAKAEAKIGVIGGSGLYEIAGMTGIQEISVSTPFGKPSDVITAGELEGIGIAFLPRHGKGHRIMPTELPSRANIYALKSLGVETIIAINSAGSFKKEVKPGQLLIPDQLIDRTRGRASTFFGEGIVAHIGFAEPFCPNLRKILFESAQAARADVHRDGIMVVMEGPAFSTRAESQLYKSWGADIIGMTAIPEAKLAREAEICYAVIGCVTDYDSWWEPGIPVTVDMIIETMNKNIEMSKKIIKLAVGRIKEQRDCTCPHAMENAIITNPKVIPAEAKKKLELIIGKYVK